MKHTFLHYTSLTIFPRDIFSSIFKFEGVPSSNPDLCRFCNLKNCDSISATWMPERRWSSRRSQRRVCEAVKATVSKRSWFNSHADGIPSLMFNCASISMEQSINWFMLKLKWVTSLVSTVARVVTSPKSLYLL